MPYNLEQVHTPSFIFRELSRKSASIFKGRFQFSWFLIVPQAFRCWQFERTRRKKMTPGGEALGSVSAGPERGERPAKKQKLETAEMSLTSINPTAPHKGRQPQTQTQTLRSASRNGNLYAASRD
jgi:hypothetical protein